VKQLVAWLVLTALAVAAGFALAWVAFSIAQAVLPPFRPEDGDSWREYGPVLVAYGAWFLTAAIGSVLAWRWVRTHL
jgi:hypothetical protein